MLLACDYETETGVLKDMVKHEYMDGFNDDLETVVPISHHMYNPILGHIETRNFTELLRKLVEYKEGWGDVGSKFKPVTIVYHNLKYDFAIMIYELQALGLSQNIMESKNTIVHNKPKGYVEKDDNYFTIIGSNKRDVKMVSLCYMGLHIKIIDSYLMFPKSLEDFGKTFGVETSKQPYDFANHVNGTNWDIIKDRGASDCQILYDALVAYQKATNSSKATVSSMSFEKFVESLDVGYRSIFPVLEERHRTLSEMTYTGGLVLGRLKGITLDGIKSMDRNSMYPAEMSMRKLPCGIPKRVTKKNIDKEKYQECIVYISYGYKKDVLPFIRTHSANTLNKVYGYDCDITHTTNKIPDSFTGYLALNSVDLETLRRHGKIRKLVYIEIYEYDVTDCLQGYIKKLSKLKEEYKAKGDKVNETIVKLQLNSLYGKFGQNVSGESVIYSLDGDYKVHVEDVEGVFTPLASAVTAYSRRNLLKMCDKVGWVNVVYTDTDSIFWYDEFNNTDVSKYVDDVKLGFWDIEKVDGEVFVGSFKWLGMKTYLYEGERYRKVRVVGLPTHISAEIPTKLFNLSLEIELNKRNPSAFQRLVTKSRYIQGGIGIQPIKFTIRGVI